MSLLIMMKDEYYSTKIDATTLVKKFKLIIVNL